MTLIHIIIFGILMLLFAANPTALLVAVCLGACFIRPSGREKEK